MAEKQLSHLSAHMEPGDEIHTTPKLLFFFKISVLSNEGRPHVNL